MSDTKHIIESEYGDILNERIKSSKSKLLVVGTGITSSHLGDERNIREFMIASEIVTHLRAIGQNTLFLLIDDSYDPLDFRQLRVAVKKDEALIKKFEPYCNMPIRNIPDPYDCHPSYSLHFQSEILDRFRTVGILPNVIDTHTSYTSHLYDFAKEIVFTKYENIQAFLKKRFPGYTMKKIFWPVCKTCGKMDEVRMTEIKRKDATVHCGRCDKTYTIPWRELPGKFSWKIDAAVKWNIFKTDFEPFSKAYLDPDVGSYFIAKAISEEFFGGHSPVAVPYGQVFMDRSLSYKLLPALPADAFRMLFMEHPKRDITISVDKVIQMSKHYMIHDGLSYYDYTQIKLPYEAIERYYTAALSTDTKTLSLIRNGKEFASGILKIETHPKIPTSQDLTHMEIDALIQIRTIFEWAIRYKVENIETPYETFSYDFDAFLKKKNIKKMELFPLLRKLLSQEHGIPISRLLYFIPNAFIHECFSILDEHLTILEKNQPSSAHHSHI